MTTVYLDGTSDFKIFYPDVGISGLSEISNFGVVQFLGSSSFGLSEEVSLNGSSEFSCVLVNTNDYTGDTYNSTIVQPIASTPQETDYNSFYEGETWATATEYSAGIIVQNGATSYICVSSNTSETDNKPGEGEDWEDYWEEYVPVREFYGSPSLKVGISVKLYYNAAVYDITEYVKSFSMHKRNNDDLTWQMSLGNNNDRDLSTDLMAAEFYSKLGFNNWSGPILEDKKISTLKRWIKVTVKQGDQTWYSGKLIITSDDYGCLSCERNISGGTILSTLYSRSQNMDPWEDTTAREIIEDVLTAYGVADKTLDFTDYPVKNFSLVECSPIDRIKELLFVGMATFYMEGDRFVAKNDQAKIFNADKVYVDRLNIIDLKKNGNMNDYYNEILLGKEMPVEGMCIIEGDQFGFHFENLCMPLLAPQVQILDTKNGTITEIWTGNDSQGIQNHGESDVDFPVAGYHLGYSGPATWISFQYRQAQGLTGVGLVGTTNGYKIRVTGLRPEEVDSSGQYETNFNFHYVDTFEQEGDGAYPGYGVHKMEYTETDLIPNQAWAEKLAKWVTNTHIRNRDKINMDIVSMDFTLNPGMTIWITNWVLGTNQMRYYVDSIDYDFVTCKTTVNASRIFTDRIGSGSPGGFSK
jgi:hypothetical protein